MPRWKPRSVPRELAAELWRVVPAREQAAIVELLRGGVSGPADLRRRADELAAELGLLVDGSIARSARALARDDESLRMLPLASDADYVAAVAASAGLRALIRLGFSDLCLAARGAWLRESVPVL